MYKLDINNSKNASILSLFISFIIIFIVMLLIKPHCIQIIDRKGIKTISIKILISYSLTFSLVISIIVLLLKTQPYKLSNNLQFQYKY
jgi:hypothetical protein